MLSPSKYTANGCTYVHMCASITCKLFTYYMYTLLSAEFSSRFNEDQVAAGRMAVRLRDTRPSPAAQLPYNHHFRPPSLPPTTFPTSLYLLLLLLLASTTLGTCFLDYHSWCVGSYWVITCEIEPRLYYPLILELRNTGVFNLV